MQTIAENYQEILRRVEGACLRSGRDPREVVIVGATKQVEPARILQVVEAGLKHVGENYLQEALSKHESLRDRVTWHFIGHLQTNKVRQAVRVFDWIQSVDRIDLAREISRRAASVERTVKCLIEVNLGDEASKSGVSSAGVADLVQAISELPSLQVVGLMAIPPARAEPEESRPDFRRVKELARTVGDLEIPGVSMGVISMGMTHDFETAIEEGATLVRIGTGIFGPRH